MSTPALGPAEFALWGADTVAAAPICIHCGERTGAHCPVCAGCPRHGRRPAFRWWQRWFPRHATGCPVHEVIAAPADLTWWTPLGGGAPCHPEIPYAHPMRHSDETEVPR